MNGYLAISEDRDEMSQMAKLHQGLHCLLKHKTVFLERTYFFKKKYYLKIINCDSSIYKMDHPTILHQNLETRFIDLQDKTIVNLR